MMPVFRAHAALSTCRNTHGHIPWTAIDRYAERYRIDLHFLEELIDGCEQITKIVRAKRHGSGDKLPDGSKAGHPG